MWVSFAQKLYLGIKKMCKKFREHPTVGLDLCRDNILTTPPNRAMDSPMVEWCYRIYSMVKYGIKGTFYCHKIRKKYTAYEALESMER